MRRTIPRVRSTAAAAALLAAIMGPVTAAAAPPPAPTVRVVIDARIELMSIVCRLAEFPEYAQGRVPTWTAAVDSHFARFATHPAVELARTLRREAGIGHDAPMSLAIRLDDGPGFAERASLEPLPEPLAARWPAPRAREFLAAVRDFARETDFAAFWAAQAPLRRVAADRLESALRGQDIVGWLERFHGAPWRAQCVAAAALLNGGASYEARVRPTDGPDEVWCILGVRGVDAAGLPTYDASVPPTVAHEFAHAFVNPLVDAHAAALRPAGEALFARVAKTMASQAYGDWRIMICESLVRANCACWLQSAVSPWAAQTSVDQDRELGFLWVGDLSDLFGEYESSRDRYPTLADFLPRVTALLDGWTARIGPELARLDAERQRRHAALQADGPRVVASVPPVDAAAVDPALPAITVTFDRPMNPNRLAAMALAGGAFPTVAGGAGFDSTGTVLTIPVRLAPATTYALSLNSDTHLVMQDEAGQALAPFALRFSTAK